MESEIESMHQYEDGNNPESRPQYLLFCSTSSLDFSLRIDTCTLVQFRVTVNESSYNK